MRSDLLISSWNYLLAYLWAYLAGLLKLPRKNSLDWSDLTSIASSSTSKHDHGYDNMPLLPCMYMIIVSRTNIPGLGIRINSEWGSILVAN